MKKLRTADEVRQWLSYQGITVSQWAREHGFSISLVFEVLAGRKKCRSGRSHNIAVLLGMKHGEITSKPARVSPTKTSTARQRSTTAEGVSA